MREEPNLFVNLFVFMVCCACLLAIFVLVVLHEYAVPVSIIGLAFMLVLVTALAIVLIMGELNKQRIARTKSSNQQGLRHKRVCYREELPLDANGVPFYLPKDAQPNPQQQYRSVPIYEPTSPESRG